MPLRHVLHYLVHKKVKSEFYKNISETICDDLIKQ